MKFPEEYYYHAKESAPIYDVTPPGDFVMERCIAGKPCWRKPKLDSFSQSQGNMY